MLVFENPGEIDPRLIRTFGANVKLDESAIGFFGTGLKYAIAVALRCGDSLRIESGLTTYEFSTRTENIRGKDFSFVTMNDEPLGFTLELGKQWKPWMAYRELHCNSKDEGGRVYRSKDAPQPKAGVTRVLVDGPTLDSVFDERHKYFIESVPLSESKDCEIHLGPGHGIFYRGILVQELQQPSIYCYNILKKLKLTEDRTLSDSWTATWIIAATLAASDNEAIIKRTVAAKKDFFESRLYFNSVPSASVSDTFIRVVRQLAESKIANLNRTAVDLCGSTDKGKVLPKVTRLTQVEQATLAKALDFCSRIGHSIESEVHVADMLGDNCLGAVIDDEIWLSRECFRKGTKYVAGTLIEEQTHKKHGFADCTRELQNFLLDSLVSLGEELLGKPL